MIAIGDMITWMTLNKVMSGKAVKDCGKGDWLVALDNGKYVIINESSIERNSTI